MLNRVKSILSCLESDTSTFEEYYRDYVIKVQDENIDNEMSFLLSNNDLTPMRMCKLADKSIERLVRYFDRSERSQK